MTELQAEIESIVKFHIGAAGDQRAFQRELSDLACRFAENYMKKQREACAQIASGFDCGGMHIAPEIAIRETPLMEIE